MQTTGLSRSTPIGCIFGFLWVLILAVDIACFVVWRQAYDADPPKIEIGDDFLKYGIGLSILLVITIIPIIKKCLRSKKTEKKDGRGISF